MDEVPTVEADRDEAGPEPEIVGGGSFWNTEAQHVASRRAMNMALNAGYDGWIHWLTFFILGHLLVGFGALLLLGTIGMGKRPWNSATDAIMFGIMLIMLATGLVLCDRYVYGRKRRFRKEFSNIPGAGGRVEFAFTPDQLLWHSPTSDFRGDWRLFPTVVELRDGFVLLTQTRTGAWLPKHAFQPPFDAEAAGAFLRSKASAYKVLNRVARLGE